MSLATRAPLNPAPSLVNRPDLPGGQASQSMLFHGQAEEGDKPLRGRIPRSGIQIVVDPPDSYTGPGVAVQNGGADPKFGVAGAEGACHEALPRQLHPMHPLTGREFSAGNVPAVFLSARLRRWYPLHFLQMARPRYFEARSASFRTMAPAGDGVHGVAF